MSWPDQYIIEKVKLLPAEVRYNEVFLWNKTELFQD